MLGFFIHLATARYFNRLYPNLGSNIPIPLDILSNNWQYVLSTNAFEAEIRGFCQIATLPNGYQIILQGGIDQGMFNDTILFDVSQKTWQRLTPYIPSNGKKIWGGTATNIPSVTMDTIGFFGGTTGFFFSKTDSVPKVTGPPGFANLTVFNTTSKTWSYFIPQNNVPSAIPIFHTATLDPRSGIIYYLGGEIIGTTEPSISQISWGYTFNTANGDWNTRNYTVLNGNFPSGRVYHTSTMAPNSQHIILFGGADSTNRVVSDYLFTLDLQTNTWVQVRLNSALSLPRFGHSAVLVNNTLFILSGEVVEGLAINILAIDVTDVSNIYLASSYPYTHATTNPTSVPSSISASNVTGTTNSTDTLNDTIPSRSSSLSPGAKAGIAIGVIIGPEDGEDTVLKEGDNVDWDKIENQYFELKTPPMHKYLAPESLVSQVRVTPDAALDSTYTVQRKENISQTPDVREEEEKKEIPFTHK
ncbi:hypothetical protein CU097_013392 [Rhizopus azygosporus]|uniref:Galactose oxidase n=1 Tax=Rhizopus azygosporus TaxID=86630 RepID=A0A367JY28_RHIAZ|nr:hypothetical protein CU097_013392 [Rhizopus azygosporus]